MSRQRILFLDRTRLSGASVECRPRACRGAPSPHTPTLSCAVEFSVVANSVATLNSLPKAKSCRDTTPIVATWNHKSLSRQRILYHNREFSVATETRKRVVAHSFAFLSLPTLFQCISCNTTAFIQIRQAVKT